jgi:hypothetical protein
VRTRGQRRILIGAAVGLIAVIAFFLRPAAGTWTAVGSTVARTAGTPPPTPSPAPSPPAATPSPGGGSAPGLDALPPDALVASAAAEYRRRARYPRSSQPLDDGPDPLERDREVSRVTQHGQSGEDPALTVYPRATGFEEPEPAILHAYLTNGGTRIRAGAIRGTIMTEDLQPIGEVEYRDDGTGGDAAANDRVYTAVFLPDVPALSRSFLVQVVATTRRGDERRAATSFLYSRPHAHLTGNFRDAVVNGNLEVGVEVEVSEAGRFHVEATLYAADGTKKVAWAQAARALEPGRQWLPLQFYGLILREKDLAGPYLVRWVALSTTTEMPNAKNRLTEANHRTAAYDPSLFTDRPFDDPDMVDAAARAERPD